MLGLSSAVLVGCADGTSGTTRPSSVRERQDAALRDPFNYSPDIGQSDISGGGLTEFDKDGFKKDVDRVFNP